LRVFCLELQSFKQRTPSAHYQSRKRGRQKTQMNLLCPSNIRMMVPRNVFCSATCPVRTAAERAPREVGVLPGIWARAQAGAPAALCGRASSLETRNLFPLAPLLGTRFPHRSPIHSPHLRITQACFSGSQPRNLQNSVTNSYSGKVISTATSHRAPL
jgi:hypothetical protein